MQWPVKLWGGKDRRELRELELRIRTVLPEEYQDSYESVQPVSMGSAGLKHGEDGKVAWDDMWDTFCDLAMAGGPPHKGRLLEAAWKEDVEAQPRRYKEAVEEICRGIRMVTDLAVMPSPVPGWVRVHCDNAGTAGWLTRAIVMENVSARCEGAAFDLPAGPDYRVEKEIKNVITVMAKTCHYFIDHTEPAHRKAIFDMFAALERELPFVQAAVRNYDLDAGKDELLGRKMGSEIREATGLTPSETVSAGWLGVECETVRAAIWMMRAMVATNVSARREETVLFVPVNPSVVTVIARVHRCAQMRGVADKMGFPRQ